MRDYFETKIILKTFIESSEQTLAFVGYASVRLFLSHAMETFAATSPSTILIDSKQLVGETFWLCFATYMSRSAWFKLHLKSHTQLPGFEIKLPWKKLTLVKR